MKKVLALTSLTLAVFALPLVSFAALNNIDSIGRFIIDTINNVLVPVIFAIAFIVFLWGVFQTFIIGATNDTAKGKGKDLMLYGLIGFFVMLSVWGLVNILTGTFGISGVAPSGPPPQAPFGI